MQLRGVHSVSEDDGLDRGRNQGSVSADPHGLLLRAAEFVEVLEG